jgi:hypothetical protein
MEDTEVMMRMAENGLWQGWPATANPQSQVIS